MPQVSRGQNVARALDLIIELRNHRFGMDLDEIQLFLGVQRRTMYRYLSALEEAGVKLAKVRDLHSRPPGWRRVIRLVDVRGFKLTQPIDG